VETGRRDQLTTAISKGMVVIDTPVMLRTLKPGFGAGETRGNLLLHELGHVAGLAHVNNPSLQMNLNWDRRTPNGYGGGDLAGLARLARRACPAGRWPGSISTRDLFR
jgi:hypothetical protein